MENFGELLLFSWSVQMPISGASRAQGPPAFPPRASPPGGGWGVNWFYTSAVPGRIMFTVKLQLLL